MVSTPGEEVAIDGKTLSRHSRDANDKAFVRAVTAWATHHEIVFGEPRTDAKSNEIAAILKLLELVPIKSSILTIDAMMCQKKIARRIVESGTTCWRS